MFIGSVLLDRLGLSAALPCAGMCAIVQQQQLIRGQMSILLGRTQRDMPQHFLNGPQIGSFIQKMCGERMPQGMRSDRPSGELAEYLATMRATVRVVRRPPRLLRKTAPALALSRLYDGPDRSRPAWYACDRLECNVPIGTDALLAPFPRRRTRSFLWLNIVDNSNQPIH